ncbi:MAG TPA: asparagine synthase-related protein [Rhodanobacteraceae bacterium]|nr:asparagine synthase-related protein [Rhodanobacteraceae bacterium]
MIIGTRDSFGFGRQVYHPCSGAFAESIHALLRDHSLAPGEPDRAAIVGYLGGQRLPGHTILQDVRAVPPGHALQRLSQGLVVDAMPNEARPGDLNLRLRASLQAALHGGKRVALALSGGLDSALLLALLKAMDAPSIPVYILAANLPDYSELDAALDTAHRLGAEAIVVEVREESFVAALPEAIRHVEEPLFNLHPVAKLLLAKAMRQDGIELAISGDGADQVLKRDRSANYLPLCKTLFDAAGVTLHAPFLDTDVIAHLVSLPPDPDKPCLRELGETLQLPAHLVHGPKRSRLAPPMDLGALLDKARIAALSSRLRLPPPELAKDAERVLWATLLLVLDQLGVAT